MRSKLAAEYLRLGLSDLDAAVLQQNVPRRITQLVSLEAYKLDYPGIYYRSRYGLDLENWALFEPFGITQRTSQRIARDDSTLLRSLQILGLKLS